MKKTMIMLACALALAGCRDNEEGKLNQTELTLTVGNTFQLVYNGGEDCEWSSDQPLIATVDDNGLVEAVRRGETTIRAGEAECKVAVEGRLHTYEEPFLGFGASKSEVKQAMSNFQQTNEIGNNLYYKGNGDITNNIILSFKDNLYNIGIVNVALPDAVSAAEFLTERYVYIGEYEESLVMMDVDETIIILIKIDYVTSIAYGSAITDKARIASFASEFSAKKTSCKLSDQDLINEIVSLLKSSQQ